MTAGVWNSTGWIVALAFGMGGVGAVMASDAEPVFDEGPPAAAQDDVDPHAAPKGFAQKIPASLVKIKMLGVPGATLEDGTKLAPFYLARTETTWDAYDAYRLALDLPEDERAGAIDAETRPTKPYGAPDYGYGHDGYAAISLTHQAASNFCAWLTESTEMTWRLPTAAEYEYACRAGEEFDPEKVQEVAWLMDNSRDRTHPVGSKPANAWGFHDLLGNVGEWVTTGDEKKPFVLAGGSFMDFADDVTPAYRDAPTEMWSARDPQVPKSEWWHSDAPFAGFRVLCEVKTK